MLKLYALFFYPQPACSLKQAETTLIFKSWSKIWALQPNSTEVWPSQVKNMHVVPVELIHAFISQIPRSYYVPPLNWSMYFNSVNIAWPSSVLPKKIPWTITAYCTWIINIIGTANTIIIKIDFLISLLWQRWQLIKGCVEWKIISLPLW